MADPTSQSEPPAPQEVSSEFKKPVLPVSPAVRSKAPASSPPTPEDVEQECPAVLLDPGCREPQVPSSTQPDGGETGSPPGEPPRSPRVAAAAAAASGGPARAPPYQEPSWGSPATAPYSLETLKGGTILGTRTLQGMSCFLFGRLASCDVCLEHPSVSRYHAVLQHRGSDPDGEADSPGRGFYLYDLGSTHGTFLNKTRIPPRTYCRVHVGHVFRFGGSTRLFILQGPEEDREAESELTVTQLKELRKQQQLLLEKKMLGEDSDGEEETDTTEGKRDVQDDEMGCTWGMGEDAVEDEAEENPIALEFQQDREAFYIKDPKKALQGFFDREGEELEYEFDEQGHSTWLCRVRLPVDDSTGKQLVAEAIHSGKKKEAMIQCSLEACRILDTLGLLRQEAVSRKRKAKNWEDEDFYDSDDDTFLDRTGLVEKKRLNRMKKAGKIDEKPETFESLVAKLNDAERELSEISERLKASSKALSESSSQDSLDAFMSEMKSGSTLDGVSRKKLHLRTFELRKEQQRLKGLIKLVKPAEIPELKKTELQTTNTENKAKKLALPLFGAMKGGSKFKLKTGTVGKLPPKRPELPPALMKMKDEPEVEEEEEEEEEEEKAKEEREEQTEDGSSRLPQETEAELGTAVPDPRAPTDPSGSRATESHETMSQLSPAEQGEDHQEMGEAASSCEDPSVAPENDHEKNRDELKKKKAPGPSKFPPILSSKYPEDDPDYCVWVPPEGQSGDGRTHLNDKYGY
ncbi:kanadaptin isoform X1 [Peromyscus maniculatus bairdii]|uniref:Solute carrier family 4 (anion exchanger), member 1, adaptor protein n=1 Tax=Peromyscus maniculatus bairdii TaxID=230844 RepID=A0A6I9LUJ8_PERMB|nr:kanadaptin isoform X1 [Peromyscus maniculatus bairdii]